jgi:hypothetical protein
LREEDELPAGIPAGLDERVPGRKPRRCHGDGVAPAALALASRLY